jgi:hypothetical protein
MLYDAAEEVLGWASLPLAGGIVESLAVTSSADGRRDTLTMVVRREIDGQTVRAIEELALPYGALPGDVPLAEAHHLFAAGVFTPVAPQASFDCQHLIGEDVFAWTDEGQFGPITVPATGIVELPVAVGRAIIGLFDESHYVELFDAPVEAQEGDLRGQPKRLQVTGGIVLHKTAAGYVRGVERHFGRDPILHDRQMIFQTQVAADLKAAYSGITQNPAMTGSADEVNYRFEPFGAAPMTVLATISPVSSSGGA